MGRRAKKKGRKKHSVPDKEWAERLEKNMRDIPELQDFLRALNAAGGFSQDVVNLLYGYCAWESLFTGRMARWREHLAKQYANAEKSLLKVASDIEEVNCDTYLTCGPWGQLIEDASVALRQELKQPALVASEIGDQTIGITPVDMTVDLPRRLRIFADHLKQLRTAASTILFARRLGRNYELLELYLYLCCIKGIEPLQVDEQPLDSPDVQRKRLQRAVCGEVALLIGAASPESIEPEVVEKDIENFKKMNPWLYKAAEQKFSEYRRYRARAQEEHKAAVPYHEWIESAQSDEGGAAQ